MNTMNALWVMPKIAGIESIAKTRSVKPIATKTRIIGVHTFLPPITVRSLGPSYESEMLKKRRMKRTSPVSVCAEFSCDPGNACRHAV